MWLCRSETPPASRYDISAELKFTLSDFYVSLRRPDTLKESPFGMIYEIVSPGSQRLESEGRLYGFMKSRHEDNPGNALPPAIGQIGMALDKFDEGPSRYAFRVSAEVSGWNWKRVRWVEEAIRSVETGKP
jgi:hypothetical protein